MTLSRTLYGKLAVISLTLLLALGIVYVGLSLYTTQHHFKEVQQRLNRELAEHLVAEKILFVDGTVNESVLKDVFHMLMVINPNIELYLLGPAGDILAYSAPPETVVRERVSLQPIARFLNQESLPILGDDPRDTNREKIFSVASVGDEGYIYIILASEEYDSAAQMVLGSYILRLGSGLAAFAFVFILVVALISFRLLTRRLNRLARDMDRFQRETSGSGSLLRGGREGDEIDRLAASFDDMARVIREQVDRLERTDTLRRELVANVSHDLRTPLASLHGYLETLALQNEELSDDDRREYLTVALRNSERLRHLVTELFELAKLDAKEVEPELEVFSLPELVQDVVQEFQLRAKEKGVTLAAELSEKVLFVRADIRLIERVLENLIENALRHTPMDGAIDIALRREKGRVQVEIRDTGVGIAAEELPHIFERFHRLDEGVGGGLGLAISKRILELHQSVIEATSQLNRGTTFRFELAGV